MPQRPETVSGTGQENRRVSLPPPVVMGPNPRNGMGIPADCVVGSVNHERQQEERHLRAESSAIPVSPMAHDMQRHITRASASV